MLRACLALPPPCREARGTTPGSSTGTSGSRPRRSTSGAGGSRTSETSWSRRSEEEAQEGGGGAGGGGARASPRPAARRVLVLGSGTSRLPLHLASEGALLPELEEVVATDLSAVAVEKMAARTRKEETERGGGGREEEGGGEEEEDCYGDDGEAAKEEKKKKSKPQGRITWAVADMLSLPFPDASFDAVIDKGVLDALFAGFGSGGDDDGNGGSGGKREKERKQRLTGGGRRRPRPTSGSSRRGPFGSPTACCTPREGATSRSRSSSRTSGGPTWTRPGSLGGGARLRLASRGGCSFSSTCAGEGNSILLLLPLLLLLLRFILPLVTGPKSRRCTITWTTRTF